MVPEALEGWSLWFDYAHQPPDNGTVFVFFTAFLPNSKEPMEGWLSSVQNCVAVLQYQGKSKEGLLRSCQTITSPRMGGLAARRFACKSPIPGKIHGWIFPGHTPDWKGGGARPPEAGRSGSGALESG